MVEDCAALATRAAGELEALTQSDRLGARARAGLAAAGARAGHAPVGDRLARAVLSESFPDHLREEVERYLTRLRFSEEPLTAGLEEAMRYSLLAGGSASALS